MSFVYSPVVEIGLVMDKATIFNMHNRENAQTWHPLRMLNEPDFTLYLPVQLMFFDRHTNNPIIAMSGRFLSIGFLLGFFSGSMPEELPNNSNSVWNCWTLHNGDI